MKSVDPSYYTLTSETKRLLYIKTQTDSCMLYLISEFTSGERIFEKIDKIILKW